MIGDTPRADIRGANRVKWGSFLTQTGVHHGSNNDPDYPATMVVSNFAEAIEVITSLEQKLMG